MEPGDLWESWGTGKGTRGGGGGVRGGRVGGWCDKSLLFTHLVGNYLVASPGKLQHIDLGSSANFVLRPASFYKPTGPKAGEKTR